jgi:hypothetical protein
MGKGREGKDNLISDPGLDEGAMLQDCRQIATIGNSRRKLRNLDQKAGQFA